MSSPDLQQIEALKLALGTHLWHSKLMMDPFVGTAGWSLPSFLKDQFPGEGTHLERYARVLNAAEINSSFYRDHQAQTYARWAASVPSDFQFSVKLSRFFSHETGLRETERLPEALTPLASLGSKWGALLVQLPPSLVFDEKSVSVFLKNLRDHYPRLLFWEPRHRSWSQPRAQDLLREFAVHQVVADPEPCPFPNSRLADALYLRLHGSPRMYFSKSDESRLREWIHLLSVARAEGRPAWCIFDNTGEGCATENALQVSRSFSRSTHTTEDFEKNNSLTHPPPLAEHLQPSGQLQLFESLNVETHPGGFS